MDPLFFGYALSTDAFFSPEALCCLPEPCTVSRLSSLLRSKHYPASTDEFYFSNKIYSRISSVSKSRLDAKGIAKEM